MGECLQYPSKVVGIKKKEAKRCLLFYEGGTIIKTVFCAPTPTPQSQHLLNTNQMPGTVLFVAFYVYFPVNFQNRHMHVGLVFITPVLKIRSEAQTGS